MRGTRYSILPALTTEGIIALDIFEGLVTKEYFLAFIKEQVVCRPFLLNDHDYSATSLQCPMLNPYPAKRSVVILDNCSIHHDEELRQLVVEECGQSIFVRFIDLTWLIFNRRPPHLFTPLFSRFQSH